MVKKTVTPANLRQVQRRLDRLEKIVKQLKERQRGGVPARRGRVPRTRASRPIVIPPAQGFTTVPPAD
jgi:hypothetical protein